MRFAFVCLLVGGLVPWAEAAQAQGRLASARDEVHEAADDDPPKSRRKDEDSSDDDCSCGSGFLSNFDDDGSLSEFLGFAALSVATSPWWGPRALLQDDGNEAYFGDFPFADEWDGFVVDEMPRPEWVRRWAGRYSAEYGDNFDGLSKAGGRLQLDSTSRFGIDTAWDDRREALPGGHDSLWTGDFNVVYRFAQSRRATFYTGLGVNWSADKGGGEVGINVTYGLDWFPVKPVVVSSTIDWGRLGDASLFHGRATVGLLLNRFEVFTGFDHYNLEGARLNGLVGGLRIWF